MAARDQRGKPGQQQHPTQQGASSGGARREDEYNNGYGNVYQGGYGSTMVNSNGDAYFPSYNPYQMSYGQNIFGNGDSAWSSNDALAYLGGYNTMSTDPSFGMFPPYDYSQQTGYNTWGGYGDYNSWNTQTQTNGLKSDQTQYQQSFQYSDTDFYQNPASTSAQPPSMTSPGTELTSPNGLSSNGLVSNGLVDENAGTDNGTVELEQGLQNMTVNNGESETVSPELSTEPSSSSTSLTAQTTAPTTTAQQLSPQSNHAPTQPKPQPGKPLSWAQLASQPARPNPKPAPPKMVIPTPRPTSQASWVNGGPRNPAAGDQRQTVAWNGQRPRIANGSTGKPAMNIEARKAAAVKSESELDPTLNKLRKQNKYNPASMEIDMKNARFFVIKSYSEDDIHRAIKYAVWCSTDHGNRRLDQAFKQQTGKGPIYLFYSVNGSGHFCGVAQMLSGVDYDSSANVWTQDKWKGKLEIKWIYVKDVPNNQLRHIRLENNENKPVTNSRDTQEVPFEKGKQVMGIIHKFKHTTSIFDDFSHYEKKEEEEDGDRVKPNIAGTGAGSQPGSSNPTTAARR